MLFLLSLLSVVLKVSEPDHHGKRASSVDRAACSTGDEPNAGARDIDSMSSSSMLNGARDVAGGGSSLTHGPGELVGSDGLQTTTDGSTTPPTTSTAPPLQPTNGLGRTEVVDGGNGEGVLQQDSSDVAADGSHTVLAATALGIAEGQ